MSLKVKLQKAISLIMAFLMVITGINTDGIALASTVSKYSVTLNNDSTMGGIFFDAGTLDTAARTYQKGSTVTLTVVATEGYEIDSLNITNTTSGKAVTYTMTDNLSYSSAGDITFKMPKGNVEVSATFIGQDIAVHTITEGDVDSLKMYLKSNIDTTLAKFNSYEPADILTVKQTLVNKNLLNGELTIDNLWSNDLENFDAFITQNETIIILFNTDDESDYYVGFANTMQNDDCYVSDYCFARNNVYGEVLDDCIYDDTTGIVYVPKSEMPTETDEDGNTGYYIGSNQVQLLQVYDEEENTDAKALVEVIINSDVSGVAGSGTFEISVYDDFASFQLVTDGNALDKVSSDNITVAVNGLALTEDEYYYEQNTGELTVITNALQSGIINVSITNEKVAARSTQSGFVALADYDSIKSKFDTYHTYNGKEITWTFDTMPTVGSYFDIADGDSKVSITYSGSGSSYSNSSGADGHTGIYSYIYFSSTDLTKIWRKIVVTTSRNTSAYFNITSEKSNYNDYVYQYTSDSYGTYSYKITLSSGFSSSMNYGSNSNVNTVTTSPEDGIILQCAHVSESIVEANVTGWGTTPLKARFKILAVDSDTKGDYILVGAATSLLSTQTGVGIIRLRYDIAEEYTGIRLIKTIATTSSGGSNLTVTQSNLPTMFPEIYLDTLEDKSIQYTLYMDSECKTPLGTFTYNIKDAYVITSGYRYRFKAAIANNSYASNLSLKSSSSTMDLEDVIWGLEPDTTYYMKVTKEPDVYGKVYKSSADTTGVFEVTTPAKGSAEYNTDSVLKLDKLSDEQKSTANFNPLVDKVGTTSITIDKTSSTSSNLSDFNGATFNLYYSPVSANGFTGFAAMFTGSAADGWKLNEAVTSTTLAGNNIYLAGIFKIANGKVVATAQSITRNGSTYKGSVSSSGTTLTEMPLGYYALVETTPPTDTKYGATSSKYTSLSVLEYTGDTQTINVKETEYSTGVRVVKTYYTEDADGNYEKTNLAAMFPTIYDTAQVKYTVYADSDRTTTLSRFDGYLEYRQSNSGSEYNLIPTVSQSNAAKYLELQTSAVDNDTLWGLSPKTTYYTKEVGYDTSSMKPKVSLESEFTTGSGSINFCTSQVTVLNTDSTANILLTGSVTVVKEDTSGTLITGTDVAGATFELYYIPSKSSSERPSLTIKDISSYERSVTIKNTSNTYLIGTFTYDGEGNLVATPETFKRNGYSYTAGISSDGTALTNLPIGQYALVEVKAPDNKKYKLMTKSRLDGSITDNNYEETYTFTVEEPNVNDPIEVSISKVDEDGYPVSGVLSLEGTVFKITYWDTSLYNTVSEAKANTPTATWYVQALKSYSDASSYIAKLEERYLLTSWNGNTSSELPDGLSIGTVTIEEVEAAGGYILDSGSVTADNGCEFEDKVYIAQLRVSTEGESEGELVVYTYDKEGNAFERMRAVMNNISLTITNEEERGDFKFKKTDAVTGLAMADVDFNVSLLLTDEDGNTILDEDGNAIIVETHTVTTDENGEYDSSKDNDLWFYGTGDESLWDKGKIDTKKGSLIAGKKYQITEVISDGNKGYQVDEAKVLDTFDITKDEVTDITKGSSFKNVLNPAIITKEWDSITKTHYTDNTTPEKSVVDTVTISNLPSGNYLVMGILMEKVLNDDGEYEVSPLLDDNGKIITAKSEVFNAADLENVTGYSVDNETYYGGSIDVTYDFTLTKGGKTFVIYEYLVDYGKNPDASITYSDADGLTINGAYETNEGYVSHTDMEDMEQIGTIPAFTTLAIGTETNTHEISSVGFVTIDDKIRYKGLLSGKTYTFSGVLMDKATGKALTDGNGGTITAETTFTADSTGDVSVRFTFDGSLVYGKTVVVYEYLYEGSDTDGLLIAAETDINNADQSVTSPNIITKLNSNDTTLIGEAVTFVDTVTLSNLTIGNTYTIYSSLYDKNKDFLLNITGGSVTFRADKTDMVIDVSMTADTRQSGGSKLVCYEYLCVMAGEDSVLLAGEEDTENIEQTIELPLPVKFTKTDKEGNTLSGATFILTDTEENVIAEWTSDEAYKELNLLSGEYKLTEKIAPKGYTIKENSISVKVENGRIYVDGEEMENAVADTVDDTIPVLPTTGGKGTLPFILVGSIVIMLGIYLRKKYRANN